MFYRILSPLGLLPKNCKYGNKRFDFNFLRLLEKCPRAGADFCQFAIIAAKEWAVLTFYISFIWVKLASQNLSFIEFCALQGWVAGVKQWCLNTECFARNKDLFL